MKSLANLHVIDKTSLKFTDVEIALAASIAGVDLEKSENQN